jgi:hypothetical protein
MQGNVWDQVLQDNADLENRHSRLVKHVKLLHPQAQTADRAWAES